MKIAVDESIKKRGKEFFQKYEDGFTPQWSYAGEVITMRIHPNPLPTEEQVLKGEDGRGYFGVRIDGKSQKVLDVVDNLI